MTTTTEKRSPPKRAVLIDAAVALADVYDRLSWPRNAEMTLEQFRYWVSDNSHLRPVARRRAAGWLNAWSRSARNGATRAAEKAGRRFFERAGHQDYLRLESTKGLLKPSSFPKPDVRELYAELLFLEREFGAVEWDPAEKVLAVRTDSIVLAYDDNAPDDEQVDLGPFRLALRLTEFRSNDLVNTEHLYVTAVAPVYDADGEYVHPHVADDALCFGEGGEAARAALNQGRLGDFFVIARNVLGTYNDRGPHRHLDAWFEGDGSRRIECEDCGDRGEPAEYDCADCGHMLCTYCAPVVCIARNCERHTCTECRSTCLRCQGLMCRDCNGECMVCGQAVCPDCSVESMDEVCCAACAATCSACGTVGPADEMVTRADNRVLCGDCAARGDAGEDDGPEEEEEVPPTPTRTRSDADPVGQESGRVARPPDGYRACRQCSGYFPADFVVNGVCELCFLRGPQR